MHKIDLKKYDVRTDMVLDLTEKEHDIKSDYYVKENIKVSWINLDDNNKIGKASGDYLTLEFDDVTDSDSKVLLERVFNEEFSKMLEKVGYKKNFKTLVVGLGNIKSTPDSLGPLSSDKIIVTNHLFDMGIDVDEKFSKVMSITPGVTASSGIETRDYLIGVVKKVKPDLVIVIDSLASSSISRVNKSIQVSNGGISPGSGIGNKRKEISKDTLGIPVIAVGIPTVVDAIVIVADTINYMFKNYAYNKNKIDKKYKKFLVKPENYLKEKIKENKDDKKTFLGLVGELEDNDLRMLIYEVLSPIGYDLMVTPKEIDFVIEKLSDVISYGINHSLHQI